MDKVILKGVEVFAYHGAIPEENRLGQKFYIDLTLYRDLRKAGREDSLEDTIHYGFVHDDVVKLTKENTYLLIERLAEEIARLILTKYAVEKIDVKIRKPNAPINGHFEYAGVEITRSKDEYR